MVEGVWSPAGITGLRGAVSGHAGVQDDVTGSDGRGRYTVTMGREGIHLVGKDIDTAAHEPYRQ